MADYFAHWLKAGEREGAQLPRVFYVNWFRKDADGKFLWPGFGENSRVLEWIFRRCENADRGDRVPDRPAPHQGRDRHRRPQHFSEEAMRDLLSVDTDLVKGAAPLVKEHLAFGDRLLGGVRLPAGSTQSARVVGRKR